MAGEPIAELVDQLLAQEKLFGGIPAWQEVGFRGEHRLVIPLVDNLGASLPLKVEVDAYPNIQPLRYRILLFVDDTKCVWRVDFVDDELHVNPLDVGPDITTEPIEEPHFHSWNDNRRFSTHAALPTRLPVARIMPPIRQFDAGFRWFCGEVNIHQPANGQIDLPPRTRLV